MINACRLLPLWLRAALVVSAFCVRLAVPQGFMPHMDSQGLHISMCNDYAAGESDKREAPAPAHQEEKAHSLCAFAFMHGQQTHGAGEALAFETEALHYDFPLTTALYYHAGVATALRLPPAQAPPLG